METRKRVRRHSAAYNARRRESAAKKEYGRAWHRANRETGLAAQKHRDLWRKYALTPAQKRAAVEGSDGACALCGLPGRLCVDHDHATGCYRGILCDKCNTGLGMFRDRPDLLRKAADYLEAGGSPAFDIVTFLKETWSGRDD